MSQEKELESLDLDFQESKIYILLIGLGPLSFGELIKYSELASNDVSKSLESMKNKGYVHEILGISSRYSAILPISDLKASGETAVVKLDEITSQIDEHIAKKLGKILGTLREESKKLMTVLMKHNHL
ncbi:MAG: helix-turn-helix domain-containing protein [Candidatus Hodarchaeales archaeon]|jgi:sugar-specific transcriptional regulator TrmB